MERLGRKDCEGDFSPRSLRSLGRNDKKRKGLVEMTRMERLGRNDNKEKGGYGEGTVMRKHAICEKKTKTGGRRFFSAICLTARKKVTIIDDNNW